MSASVPTYTSRGFHARIRMAKQFNLFIVTEGTESDPYFYHSIAQTSARAEVRASKVFAAENVTRKSTSGPGVPGKSGVISAFEAASAAGYLSIGSGDSKRAVLFCVDRDVDDKHDAYEHNPHFVVTSARDVEAEIFGHADLQKAVAQLASKDLVEAADIARKARRWHRVLHTAWSEWILLGAIANALESRSPGIAWGGKSLINDGFGPVDPSRKALFEGILLKDAGSKKKLADAKRSAKKRLAENRLELDSLSVIKGKWVPDFLESYLRPLCSSPIPRKGKVRSNALSAFSGALDYTASWAQRYRTRMESLF
jgi:hypothetical protein